MLLRPPRGAGEVGRVIRTPAIPEPASRGRGQEPYTTVQEYYESASPD
jgi:hypothetical protein